MKRFISFLLAFTMLAGMGARSAFADALGGGLIRLTESSDSTSLDVSGSYNAIDDGGPVYCVKIQWGNLNLKSKLEGSVYWDPYDLRYKDNRNLVFEPGANEASIKVTNYSDADVKITPALTTEENNILGIVAVPGWSTAVEQTGQVLETAENARSETDLHSVVYNLTLRVTGDPDYDAIEESIDEGNAPIKVAEIKITVAPSGT